MHYFPGVLTYLPAVKKTTQQIFAKQTQHIDRTEILYRISVTLAHQGNYPIIAFSSQAIATLNIVVKDVESKHQGQGP